MFKFKQIDKDHTGTIDWWEFLNHQALKSIATNRSKVRRLENISIGSHVTNCPLTTQFLEFDIKACDGVTRQQFVSVMILRLIKFLFLMQELCLPCHHILFVHHMILFQVWWDFVIMFSVSVSKDVITSWDTKGQRYFSCIW